MSEHKSSSLAQSRGAQTTVPQPKPQQRKLKRWVWLILAVLVIAIAWYVLATRNSSDKSQAVLAEAVTRGDLEDSITAVGTLSALRSINVGAQVSGQLKKLHVEIGDKVSQGDLLAEIDPTPIEKKIEMSTAQLDNLKAQLVSKQAQLKLKRLNADRQIALLDTRGVSKSTVDQAEADLAVADAEVKGLSAQIRQQEAQVSGDRVDLGYTKIYSPMNGTVADQAAKEGETLNAVQSAPTIVTVADLSVMTVEAQVSEADVGRLKPGMDVYFTLLGDGGKRYSGKLRRIKPTPQTDNNVVLYYALFDVPNTDGELMISMSAKVHFVINAAKDVLTIPAAALRTVRGEEGGPRKKLVTVVTASGAEEDRTVETGVQNRVQVEITSGLEDGDRVVVSRNTGEKPAGGQNNRRRERGMF